jgi:hypothetical protein
MKTILVSMDIADRLGIPANRSNAPQAIGKYYGCAGRKSNEFF